jgi:aminoglycoside/choline kinase family phosphotransferase
MVPATIDDIDSAWLEEVLADAGFGRLWLDDIVVEALAVGVGLLGSVARVRLTHADDGAPKTVIVKLPSQDMRARSIADQFGYYRREAGTYRELLHDLPRDEVRTPQCYAVVDGPIGPVIVLEDLPHAVGDQVVGASREQALAAAELLANIHAQFWDSDALLNRAWLPGPTDEVIAGYGRLFELTWPMFVNNFGSHIPREHLGAAERAITNFDGVVQSFAQAPQTLIHGDFRLDNMLFSAQALSLDDEPVAHVLDWQLAARGRGPYDLAFFVAGSVTPNQRRLHERAIIERYHGYLQLGGVSDYTLDDCWRDYHWGHVLNLPNPITAAVAVPPGNERGRQLLASNAERALAAIADFDRRGFFNA